MSKGDIGALCNVTSWLKFYIKSDGCIALAHARASAEEMRKVVHISDMHFGAADTLVVERLIDAINGIEPHLVVLSGDLTQRARTEQFREARNFLDRIQMPQIVVPGNHDVPLYNVFDRFANPLEKYQEIITNDLAPFYLDEEIAVAGVNTARSMTIKGGRISREQVDSVFRRMSEIDESVSKVIVTHHPFDVPEGRDEDDIVKHAKKALPRLVEAGADVFLAGHLHVSHIGHSARRYRLDNGYSALIMQAGTGASTRERGEENSFNVLEFDRPFLTVHRHQCAIPEGGFHLAATERFSRTEKGWSRM